MVYLWIIHADVLFKGFLEDLVSVEVVVIRVEEVIVDDEGVHGTADEGHVSLEQGGFLAAIATDGALLMDQGIGVIVSVFSRPIGSGASPSARGNTTVVVVIVGVAFGIVIFQFSLELKGFSEIYTRNLLQNSGNRCCHSTILWTHVGRLLKSGSRMIPSSSSPMA